MPPFQFIYGTAWKEDLTADCVYTALEAGYHAIDTANQRKHYFEGGVGDALLSAYKNLNIKREDLFLQTKFTYATGQDDRKPYNDKDPYPTQVRDSFESSLKHLHTDYLDSLILHGPFSHSGMTKEDKEVWQEMEKLVDEGLVKSIGLSNVTSNQLAAFYQFARIKPAFVQIRTFAQRKWEAPTREFCRKHDIRYQGFSLLTANREFLEAGYYEVTGRNVPQLRFDSELPPSHPLFPIKEQTGKSIAQIIFRFCLQVGIIPIIGSRSKDNLKANLDIMDFKLTPDQLDSIENIAL